MFGLGTPELLAILAIAAVLFGGKKLPEIGTNLGKAFTGFKQGVKEIEEAGQEIASEIPDINTPTSAEDSKKESATNA